MAEAAPYPSPILLTAVLGTQTVAALVVVLGLFVAQIPWIHVGVVRAYALVRTLVLDEAKLLVYRRLEPAGYGAQSEQAGQTR
jgi:H+-transporting ATPase